LSLLRVGKGYTYSNSSPIHSLARLDQYWTQD